MASKQFALDERTLLTVYKRKTNRSLRLSITADGKVRVTIPVWAPYSAGVKFARSRLDWIRAQHKPAKQLINNQPIGKAHRLRFEPSLSNRISSRIRQNEVIIYHPENLSHADESVQHAANKAAIRALRKQAESLLPKRLDDLACQHDFSYNSVSIKQMKSRWGSCDQHRNIVLNLFLVQLPWEHIDYVLLHELTHTKVLRHGPDFWAAMASILPDVKLLRKNMHEYQPILHHSSQLVA